MCRSSASVQCFSCIEVASIFHYWYLHTCFSFACYTLWSAASNSVFNVLSLEKWINKSGGIQRSVCKCYYSLCCCFPLNQPATQDKMCVNSFFCCWMDVLLDSRQHWGFFIGSWSKGRRCHYSTNLRLCQSSSTVCCQLNQVWLDFECKKRPSAQSGTH